METRNKNLTSDLFRPAEISTEEGERIAGPPIGFWRDSWNRLKKNRGAVISLGIIIVLIAMAYIGPLINQYGVYEQDLARRYAEPSLSGFWFGTDGFGRDMWSRVWAGTQVSLYIALLAALLDLFLGALYGAISGFFGGKTDDAMQRVIEILNGIPYLVIAILAMLIFTPGIITISIALAVTGWTIMARIVRGRVMQLKEQEYFLASRSLGAGRSRLIMKHLFPNSLQLIVINLMFTIPAAIFAEAFLSFIGLGIQVPDASLGSLMSDGYQQLRLNSYLLWYPAAVFCLLMVCFNLLADGLRDALDPKMRK